MKYEIGLHRKTTEYRMMRVEAKTPEAARRRALAIIRSENGYGDTNVADKEDPGEWCDTSYGRPVIEGVKVLP